MLNIVEQETKMIEGDECKNNVKKTMKEHCKLLPPHSAEHVKADHSNPQSV
jgi:hypothetical protein